MMTGTSASSKAEVDKPSSENDNKVTKIEVDLSADSFDLDAYAADYSGPTLIQRLMFIANHAPQLRKSAFLKAQQQIKQGMNTSVFKELCTTIEKNFSELSGEFSLDKEWIESTDLSATQLNERLEAELMQFRANNNKPGTRMAYINIGQYYVSRGEWQSALRSFVKTRDLCSSSSDIIEMHMNMMKVSVHMGKLDHVSNYAQKAEQTRRDTSSVKEQKEKAQQQLMGGQGDVVGSQLKCASALSHIDAKKFRNAARKLLEVTDIGDFSEMMSKKDVAVYASLCALATFDRNELNKKVLENQAFKNFLELTPNIQRILTNFHNSRYNDCFSDLEKLKPYLLLDVYLQPHVDLLFQKIRNKGLVQYFTPFSSVDMNEMAQAFNSTVADLEKELVVLISEGTISARIDSHSKRLYARTVDQRSETYRKVLRHGEDYEANVKALLQRMNVLSNDIVVKYSKQEQH